MNNSFSHLLPRIAVLLALVALPSVAAATGYMSVIPLVTRALIYGIAAASLNFALGYGGLISLGHAAFFGAGAYTVGILYQHHSLGLPLLGVLPGTDQLLISLPAAMLVSGLLAAAIGALSIRTSGVQFIMITLAFAQMLFFLFVSLKSYGGDDGLIIRQPNNLFGLNMRDRQAFYYVSLAFSVLWFVALSRLIGSRFGAVVIGLRQSERRMASIGVSPYPYKLVAFIISGIGCGLAGGLMANFLRFVSPDMMHWTKSGEFMIMVILGGVATRFGPWIGAVLFILLESILSSWTENWQLGLGAILLGVVLFTNGGIQALGDRLVRRLAR